MFLSPPSPSHASQYYAKTNKNEQRISREWRQKIESWLQANEQDEKHGDEYRRRARRLAGNRRSYENDSGKQNKTFLLRIVCGLKIYLSRFSSF